MTQMFKNMFTGLVLLIVAGCTSLGSSSSENLNQAQTLPSSDVEHQGLPSPPNLELTSELLEQLMVTNFASYGADWQLAAQSALSAAEDSQDFRLARLATVLALRLGDYKNAVRSAELWSQLHPESDSSSGTLILALLGAGETESAIQKIRSAELEQQDFDNFFRQIAGILIRQPNADSAMAVVDDFVDRHSESAQVLLSSSYVASYFKQTDKAELWLEKTLELRPSWDLAAQMKVSMLRQQGKTEERIDFIDQYLDNNPDSISIRMSKAVEYARDQSYQSAFDLMLKVVDDDPNNATALNYSAALALQLNKEELSEDLYERALANDPHNDELRWTLARFAIDREQYSKAEEIYQQIQGDDLYFRAQLQVANMRYKTSGLNRALNILHLLEPESEDQYIDLAITRHYLLMQEKEYEEAFAFINETIVYLPENEELVYARSLVAAELGEIDVVESDLRGIIQRDPNHANALNALGYTLADQTDRYDEAKELISKALELRPTDAHILDSMGWVLYRLNDFENAIIYLQKAYDDSSEVEIAAHLGEVLWESGEREKATEIWVEALERDPSNTVLNETLERYQPDMLAEKAAAQNS